MENNQTWEEYGDLDTLEHEIEEDKNTEFGDQQVEGIESYMYEMDTGEQILQELEEDVVGILAHEKKKLDKILNTKVIK